MQRNTLNFAVDLVSLLVMWGLLTTGLLMKYVLPAGTGHWLTVKGWNRHDWGDVHFWLAVAACGLVFVHVLLHWQWVCATVRRYFSRGEGNGGALGRGPRIVGGVGLVLALTVGTVGLLMAGNAAVVASGTPGGGQGHHVGRGRGDEVRLGSGGREMSHNVPLRRDMGHGDACNESIARSGGYGIRGSSNLTEVAEAAGLSIDEVRARLGVPQGTAAGERIGRLGRRYGFSVTDARTLIESRRVSSLPSANGARAK